MAAGPSRTRPSNQPSSASPTDTAGLVAGLATVVLWGSAFVGIRAAQSLSPGALALGRLLVSTIALTAVALLRRERLPRPRDLVSIAAYGTLWLAIYSVALNAAERRIDAGTAAMLIATGPILIAVLAGFLLGEGFPPNLFLGCAVAFAGSSMIGIGTARSAAPAAVGIALCVLAVLAYSLAVVVQKPVLARVSSFQVIWLGCAAATLVCLPFAPVLVSEAAKADPMVIGWVVYLGLFPTAIGFATWGFALRRTTAGRTGSMLYLVPLVAVALGWAILRETPPVLALLGGALCLTGVYLARRPSATRPQTLVANEAQASS